MSHTPPGPPLPPDDSDGPSHGRSHGPGSAHGRPRRIVREPDDRRIAGVCSGLADHLGVDVTVLRVSAVALALITPAALIGYLVASVALPERRPDEPRVLAQRVHLGAIPHPIIIVGAVVAVAALVDRAWWLDPFPAAVALVGVGVWLIFRAQQTEDAAPLWPTSPRPPTPPSDGDPRPARFVAGPVGTPTDAPIDAPVDAADGAADEDRGVVHHPMASSPWLVSVSRQFNAEGVGDTTLTHAATAEGPGDALGASVVAGSSSELPPPVSPWWSGGGTGAPAPPSERTGGRSVLGSVALALVVAGIGVLWLLDTLDVVELSGRDLLALALVLTGATLVVAAWRGRAAGMIPVAAVLIGVLTLGELLSVPVTAGTGDRTVVVTTAEQLAERHELFAGELTLDLTDAPLRRSRPTRLEASVSVGELHVIVPRDAEVDVTATVGAGEVKSPGGADANEGGIGLDQSFTLDGDGPQLELDLSVATGNVEVTRG